MKYNLTYIINNEQGKFEYDGGEWEVEKTKDEITLKQSGRLQKEILLSVEDSDKYCTIGEDFIHISPLYLDGIEYYFKKI